MPGLRGPCRSALRSVRSHRASAPRRTLPCLRRGQWRGCNRLRCVCRLLPRARARTDLPIGNTKAPALGVSLRPHRLLDACGLLAASGVVERFHLLDRLIGPVLSIQAARHECAEETHEHRVAKEWGASGIPAEMRAVRFRRHASDRFRIRHLDFASPTPLSAAAARRGDHPTDLRQKATAIVAISGARPWNRYKVMQGAKTK
jgi:hypothetical protein